MKFTHATILLACTASAAAGDLSMLPAPVLLTPHHPRDIELADLDGDGLGDLLTVEDESVLSGCLVKVRAGLGGGRFGEEQSIAWNLADSMLVLGQQLATVDLDADGDLDVIVAPSEDEYLQVLRNEGSFNFPFTMMHLGNNLRAVATGDVNGDGLQDAVVASYATNQLLVLHGNGAAALQLVQSPTSGVGPTSLAVADLDMDGWLDIASANAGDGQVGVLLAQGGGAFAPATGYAACGSPGALASADLTGDGKPELIAGCSGGGLQVLPNIGSGLFGAAAGVPVVASLNITDILPVDLDGNGTRDLVLGASNGKAPVLFGTGTGSFITNANSSYPTPDNWSRVALGELGGDTLPDVLVSSFNELVAFSGFGAVLDAPAVVPVSGVRVALGDVTGDGNLDVIGTDETLKAITVRLGNGTDALDTSPSATVSTVVGAGTNTFIALDAADLDGDGDADPVAIIGNVAQPTLAQPNGSLVLPTWFPLGFFPAAMGLFDLDGDGLPDMLSSNAAGQVRSYRGLGNGQFTLKQTVTPPHTGRFTAGDFDADGDLDVAVAGGFVGVSLLAGNGDASFAAPVVLLGSTPVTDVVLTDLDADGRADLLTTSANGLRVSLHQPDGALLPPVLYANGQGRISLGDVDADGWQDAVTLSDLGRVGVFHANGDGTLEAGQFFGGDNSATGIVGPAVGDLNADGDADVLNVCISGSTPTIRVYPSRLGQPITLLGSALAGAAGEPTLTGAGTLAPHSPMALHITQAAPLAPTTLILGFSELNAPIKGGVLVPNPDVQIIGLFTGPGGSLLLNVGWPAGVPSGFSLWMQGWIVDAGGPKGLAATNGLRLDAP